MVNAEARIAIALDRTGRLARSRRQGVFLGLRFVAIRACRPEVCRLFDQGQQR